MHRLFNTRVLTLSLALSLTLSMSAACAASAAGFTFSNAPGPHRVGFKLRQQYDYARVYKTRVDLVTAQPSAGERARPMQTLVWYPAAGKGKALAYRDYLATMATETDFTVRPDAANKSADAFIEREAKGYPQARQEAGRSMWAMQGAAEQAGKFPIVIYAPSFSANAIENADLCEYLASHGYIVLASASLGPRSRSMTLDLEGLESQVADIGFLIAQAHTMAQADPSRIAVVGFSWGGLANAMAAAKDDRIGALVSLDGSMRGYAQFIDGGKDAAKYVTPARLAVPLLYMGKRPLTVEALQKRDIQTVFSMMNQMKYADVYIGAMYPMEHADFASQALRFAPDAQFGDYSRDEVSQAHSWTMRYVQRFLDAYLKQDAAALAFLNNTPKQNGVPPHMLSMEFRRGAAQAPTMENFARLLGKNGFGQAIAAYDRFRAQDGSFGLPAESFNSWGYQLARGGRPKDGIEIFKLATHVYPKDGNLFDSLAETYESIGDKPQAIVNYRRSLELWPENKNAAARLTALGAAATEEAGSK